MQIEKIAIEKIKPYENNAKLHPPEQIEQIKKSICQFGNNDPIAIDENGVIIEGHGRYIALKELRYKQIEVIKLGHLRDEQKRAYALIHNKITMDTGFNLEILETELNEIVDIDMDDFNFSDMQFLRIDNDYDEGEKLSKTHSLYLQYKNKKIPVSSQEENILDSLIDQYVDKNGVLYGFVNEVVKAERVF